MIVGFGTAIWREQLRDGSQAMFESEGRQWI